MSGTAELPGLPGPPELGTSALPDGTFAGQSVFITGAGTGLGKAIALEFARLGAAIVIASRKPEHLEAGHEAVAALEQALARYERKGNLVMAARTRERLKALPELNRH